MDLEELSLEHSEFADRLNALLDVIGVPAIGHGRPAWIVKAANINPVAAGRWFSGTIPRKSNLEVLAAYICKHYAINSSESDLVDYLTGKYVKLDVNAELSKSGLTPPEQGMLQAVVSRAMKDKDLDPLDEANLILWTKVIIRVARYYAAKQAKGNTPDEAAVLASASAFLDLAILDAI